MRLTSHHRVQIGILLHPMPKGSLALSAHRELWCCPRGRRPASFEGSLEVRLRRSLEPNSKKAINLEADSKPCKMRLESINYSAKTHYFLLAGRQGSSMSMSNQADASMSKWFALLILAIQTFSHTSNWTRIISLAWESVCYAVYQFRPFRNSFGIPTSRDYGWRMEGGEGATKTQVSKWARLPKSPSTKFKEPHWYSDGKKYWP